MRIQNPILPVFKRTQVREWKSKKGETNPEGNKTWVRMWLVLMPCSSLFCLMMPYTRSWFLFPKEEDDEVEDEDITWPPNAPPIIELERPEVASLDTTLIRFPSLTFSAPEECFFYRSGSYDPQAVNKGDGLWIRHIALPYFNSCTYWGKRVDIIYVERNQREEIIQWGILTTHLMSLNPDLHQLEKGFNSWQAV